VLASVVCGGVFVIGILRGSPMLQMLRTAVSLAVAAVPEGLPTVAITTLAIGIQRMKQRQVIVRLTRKGRDLVDEIVESHMATEREILAALSAREQRELSAMLRSTLVHLGDVRSDEEAR